MGDTIAILPELSFRQQITELATHIARSLPTASDAAASREYITSVEASLGEGTEDVDETKAREAVKALVGKVGEARGALEGSKESDVESSHILLQHVISSTLSSDADTAVKLVVEAIRKGAEANAAAGRNARVEVAARILNNTYNALPSNSPLRANVLITLLSLLSRFTDLSVLPLSASTLSASLNAWDISTADKLAFIVSATDIYRSAGHYAIAADVAAIGTEVQKDAKTTERAVVHAVLDDERYEVVAEATGQASELVGLLKGEGVSGVQAWVEKNAKWIEGQGIAKFTPTLIVHKTRILALARLFATSPSRQLSFTDIASALSITPDEVEEYVFDGSTTGLFSARISQTTSTVRVLSVSKAAAATTDSNGVKAEWALLEKRLNEWKVAVQEARKVVGEAEVVATQQEKEVAEGEQRWQGQGQRRAQGQQQGQRRGNREGQAQQEVAA